MTGRYVKYQEYKDSGVEWLGGVPASWSVGKFRYYFQESHEKIDNIIVGEMLSVSGYRGIEIKRYDNEAQKRSEENLLGYRVVRAGQLVVNTMWLNYAGLGVSAFEGHVSPAYRSYWITGDLDKRYVHHLMRSDTYVKGYTKFLNGIRPNSLQMSKDDLMSFPVLIPSLTEQHAIANFLDHETAKIDTLIEKQQQLIKLLKEKRQAVISHAVTKGLNPDVPMKDSGVEWLGDVPAHWTVKRLKHTAKIQSGIPKGKDLAGKRLIKVPMLRVANVQDGYLNLRDVHTIKIEESDLSRYLLCKGDVLMNEGGDNDKLGRGAVWRAEIVPCIHQNHVFAIRPEKIEPEWLDLLTRASYAKFHFYRVAKQSTNLASISSSNIKETPLLVPPGEERSRIMAYLTSKIMKYEVLEKKIKGQILLLKERRTALISAAVTGKIDVRNWHQPNIR